MSRYVPSLRVIELEEDDEQLMPQHFVHARRAWATQEEVLDNAYTYSVDTEKQGVWGGSPACPSATTSGRRAFWKRGAARVGGELRILAGW